MTVGRKVRVMYLQNTFQVVHTLLMDGIERIFSRRVQLVGIAPQLLVYSTSGESSRYRTVRLKTPPVDSVCNNNLVWRRHLLCAFLVILVMFSVLYTSYMEQWRQKILTN